MNILMPRRDEGDAESDRAAAQKLLTPANLQTVGQTVRDLEALRPHDRSLAQREATQVWAPLCDRAVMRM